MVSELSKFRPMVMNIELTTKCPLRCPQCYCSLEGGKDIDIETALFWLGEGKRAGVKVVDLSGGETLCYPHLYKLIAAAAALGMEVNVAFSGAGFRQQVFDELIKNEVSGIFISLNGSTERINSLTRDGYNYAISALKLLKDNHYNNTSINWVMHSNNADDFQNIVELAEYYEAAKLVIIGVKPDSKHAMATIPSHDQLNAVNEVIRSHKGNTRIIVEACFSPMLALVSDTKLFGNLNTGKYRGCGAGVYSFSVNVEGLLSPCRHLDYYERYSSLEEYASQSSVIAQLIEMHEHIPEQGRCACCRFRYNCIPCAAINSKLEGKLYRGFSQCPAYEATDKWKS